MAIAPLAIVGIAQTAFSLLGSLADLASHPARPPQSATLPQESIWHQLGRTVDVRAMTQDELVRISAQLYDNNAISLQDHALLSSVSGPMLTTPDSQGRVDWLAEFQARLCAHQAQGDLRASQNDRSILDILGRLVAGARGVTSIRV